MSEQRQPDVYGDAYLERGLIPHSQLVVASKIMEAMAETFTVSPDSIRTIPLVEEGHPTVAAVVYVGDALDMSGGWDKIQDPDRDSEFTLELEVSDGVTVDTRPDMTYSVFKNMVRVLDSQARLKGSAYKPEALPRVYPNEVPRTKTWLTGEICDDEWAFVGSVVPDGQPKIEPFPSEDELLTTDLRGAVGFRPAVILTNMLVGQCAELHADPPIHWMWRPPKKP